MIRLLRLNALLLGFLICVLIVSVGKTPDQQSAALLNALFRAPDGAACDKPCLFGIQAEMSDGAILPLLRQEPSVQGMQIDYSADSITMIARDHTILIRPRQPVIAKYSVQRFSDQAFTLGQIIARYGPPDAGLTKGGTLRGVEYDSMNAIFWCQTPGSPAAIVLEIDVFASPYTLLRWYGETSYHVSAWHGF
jgi:hypothetical protein